MKIKRGTILRSLTVLSLLLAAAIAIAWVKSFSSQWQLFSFLKDDEKFALYSRNGQFLLVGPPTEQLKDPLSRDLVGQMSNADFEWSPIGSDYICGAARRDTPTWNVYQRFLARDRRGMGLEPNMRIFIAQAKDDPRRFVPAHMLLMLAAEPRRAKPRISPQKWLETGFRLDVDGARIPEVIMRADETQKAPNFAARWDLKQEWSDVMESPRGAVFHGWIWLVAILLPLAYLTKPRRRKATLPRWTFNSLALISSIICVAALTLWIRSHVMDEQFIFSRRCTTKPSQMDWITSIASSQGKLILLKTDEFHQSPFRDPWGYQQKSRPWPTKLQGLPITGEKSARFPGLEFYAVPSQMVSFPTRTVIPPGRAPVGWGSPSVMTQLHFGVRALSIRFWLIVLAASLIPAWWLCNALLWRKRIIHEDRHLARQCPACGYDMRATPGQCPECGEVSRESTTIPRVVRL